MAYEAKEETMHRTIRVDLSEPIFNKSASERKIIREKILNERKEAFNILAAY